MFQQLGRIIYGVGAALFNLVKGNFKIAGQEITDAFSDAKDNVSRDMEKIVAVFSENGKKLVKTADEVKDKVKPDAPNIAAAKEAASAMENALKKLTDFKNKISEQVATFGQSEVAATKYRLTIGDLADDVKAAGKDGQALKDAIIAQAEALEKLKNTDALAGIDQQILQLTGHFEEAAKAAFDLSNKALKASLTDANDTEGLKKLETLKTLIGYQEQYNELQREQQSINDSLAAQEERIQNALKLGALTELKAAQLTEVARKDAVDQLEEIRKKMDAVATASGNPELVKGVEKFGNEIDKLATQVDVLGDRIRTTFVEAGSGPLADFITGTKKAGDAVKDFFKDLERQAAETIAKGLLQQLFQGFGSSSQAGGGGFLGTLASAAGALYGGGKAKGGKVQKGYMYPVNERTGTEYFAPGMDGSIIPAGQSQNNEFNFSISAPNGSVSRQTQQQIAAAAARGIQQANRRNN